jgi:hypothetical protein
MENLHSEELRIRSRTNKWNGHIACKGKMRYNKFGLKTQRKGREENIVLTYLTKMFGEE